VAKTSGCEQLAQSHYTAAAWPGIKPATSRSCVRRHTVLPPYHPNPPFTPCFPCETRQASSPSFLPLLVPRENLSVTYYFFRVDGFPVNRPTMLTGTHRIDLDHRKITPRYIIFFQPIMDSLMKEPIAPCNQLARSTQPCIKIKYWLWPGKDRSVTFARWQVTIRDSTLWDPVSAKFVCSFTCIICHSKIVYYTLHYNKPTDQSTAGHLTATRYAWDDLACNINVELGTREAIKEEQWLSSMA